LRLAYEAEEQEKQELETAAKAEQMK